MYTPTRRFILRNNLTHLAQVFSQISDPRSKHGTYLPVAGLLALTFLGLLAGQNYFTHICRWAANHWNALKKPLGFKGKKPPNRTTLTRLLAKISLKELQDAFAVFLSQLLDDKPLTAAVDGKDSKQIHGEEGEVLQMLNVFVHDIKVVLYEWSVKGDKTNEPGCLKQHLGELLAQFPNLEILTGDAIFAQRPLLRILKDKVDYAFQVKDNQPEVLEAIKETFKERQEGEPAAESFSKKKAA
jgi:hypothetical protein